MYQLMYAFYHKNFQKFSTVRTFSLTGDFAQQVDPHAQESLENKKKVEKI